MLSLLEDLRSPETIAESQITAGGTIAVNSGTKGRISAGKGCRYQQVIGVVVCLVAWLCVSNTLLCATPNIESLSSQALQHKESITVSGSAFGIKEPAEPLIWDDFEDGIDPRWTANHGYEIGTDNNRHSHSTTNAVGDFSQTGDVLTFSKTNVGSLKWFAQFWFKFGTDFVWPPKADIVIGVTPMAQVKLFRMWPHGGGAPNYCNVYINYKMWENTAALAVENGGGGGYCSPGWNVRTKTTVETWHLQEMEFVENSAPDATDGRARYWFNTTLYFSSDVLKTSTAAYPLRGKHMGNIGGYEHYWGAPGTAMHMWVDDVYLDITLARIVLGDKATWASCTHREVQIPTAWSDTSITVMVNQGAFQDGAQAYLYVVDADGTPNPEGFPITLGEGEGPTPDLNPPIVSGRSPAPGEEDVPVNSSVLLHVQDSGDGVDSASIQMKVNNEPVTPQIAGIPADYTVTYVPSSPFDYGSAVTVTVNARDLHSPPNVMNEMTYSFTTEPGDSSPPVVTGQSPAPDEQDVPVNSSVLLHVQDSGDGVDSASIQMKVNNEPVAPQIAGTPADYTVTYVPSSPFDYGSAVTVTVNARDLHSPPNVMNEVAYSFNTVSEGAQIEEWGDSATSNHPGTMEDTFININAENYADDAMSLNTYTWPANSIANAILMKFDLSAIPTNATVTSAKLYLYMFEASSDTTYSISVHKIVNVNPVIAAATGYTCDGTTSWTSHEGLYDNIPLGQADIAAAEDTTAVDTSPGYKDWAVTNMVSEWIADAASNRGLMLNSDPNAVSDAHRHFRPSEYADADQRPRLVISYTVGSAPIPGAPGKPAHVD